MSWASRRKSIYLGGTLLVLFVVVGVPAFLWWYEPPNCFDGIRNGEELGVDCGGGCMLLCPFQTEPLSVRWSRAFRVADGFYSALAYVENTNFNAVTRDAHYRFRLFDSAGVLVAERTGTAVIAAEGPTPIFEGAIDTGSRAVARTLFEVDEPTWNRMDDPQPSVSIEEERLSSGSISPRLDAYLRNNEVFDVFDTEVVAILYDERGNAVAASRTIVPVLENRQRAPLVFTWPEHFGTAIHRIEIVPRVPPQE